MNTATQPNTRPLPAASARRRGLTTCLLLGSAIALAQIAAAQSSRESRALLWTSSSATGNWDAPDVWSNTDGDPLLFQGGDAVYFGGTSGLAGNLSVELPSQGAQVSAMVVQFASSSTLTLTGGPLSGDAAFARPGSTEISGSVAGRLVVLGAIANSTLEFRTVDPVGSLPVAPVFADEIVFNATASNARLFFNTPDATITSTVRFVPSGTNFYMKLALAENTNFAGDIILGTNTTRVRIDAGINNTLAEAQYVEISGRIIGPGDAYGNAYGTLYLGMPGTTVLSGSQNRYGGTFLPSGTLIVTSPGALGSGDVSVYGTGRLVFQGLPRTVLPMSFYQQTNGSPATSGTVAIVDSDLVFRRVPNRSSTTIGWGNLNYVEYSFRTLTLSGTSRLTAIPTGTSTSVLGGPGSNITVGDQSTLILEAHASGRADLPVVAQTLTLDGGDFVLRPGAQLNVSGSVSLLGDAKIILSGGGVASLAYGEGSDARLSTETAADPSATIYQIADGFDVTTVIGAGAGGAGANTYLVVNRGANSMQDVAMISSALNAVMETAAARLGDEFLLPVVDRAPEAKRQWTNTLWAHGFNRHLKRDPGGIERPGHSGDLAGAVAGIEGVRNQRFLVGFHAGMGDVNLRATNATRLSSAHRFMGLHAAQRFGPAYLAASVATSSADSTSRRDEETGSTLGRWENALHTGGLEVGTAFRVWRGLSLRASAAVRYAKIEVDDLIETGPGSMEIDNFSDELIQCILAARASQRFKLFGMDFAAGLSGGWKHAAEKPRTRIEGAYRSDPGAHRVSLASADYYGDTVTFGVSLRAAVTRNLVAGLSFERETASGSAFDTVSASLGYWW